MSQYPPPIDPLPYASPPIPVPPRRPTTVTVVAIIAIVWGGIATLLRLCAVPQLVYMQVSPNPMMNGFRNDAVLVALQIASLVIGLGLGILLLSGGILSLSLKPLGRTFLIVYAWAYIITAIPLIILTITVITPRTFARMPNMATTPQMRQFMKWSSYGGALVSLILLVWPVLILYFMNRPHVKRAFEEGM